jgi:hypothetical protein
MQSPNICLETWYSYYKNITVLWDVVLRSLVTYLPIFGGNVLLPSPILHSWPLFPNDGGISLLRNVDNGLSDYTQSSQKNIHIHRCENLKRPPYSKYSSWVSYLEQKETQKYFNIMVSYVIFRIFLLTPLFYSSSFTNKSSEVPWH